MGKKGPFDKFAETVQKTLDPAGIVKKGYEKTIGAAQNKEREANKEAAQRMEDAYREFDGLESPGIGPRFVDKKITIGGKTVTIKVPYKDPNDFDLSDFQQGQTTLQQDSLMGGVATDPGLKDAQMGALRKLEEIGRSGGLLAADKALLAKTQHDASMQDRGRREAILQSMAAKGMSGTGNELLAQLDSSQAATERSSQAGLDIAGMAQQRALDSIAKAGTLGGQIRSQEFDEQAKRAQAQDAINNFNAGLKTQGSFNNAGIKNNSQMNQNDMRQQVFSNQHAVQQDKANIRTGQAAQAQTRANTAVAKQGAYVDAFGRLIQAGVKSGGDESKRQAGVKSGGG